MISLIRYTIFKLDLHTHEFVVRLQVDGPLPADQCLTLPAWIPGSYLVRDFARCITAIRASDGRGPLELEKLDKHTWRVGTCDGPLTVEYQVYAHDLSVRSAYLDHTRGFFNGSSVFLRLPGFDDVAWELEIPAPSAADCAQWRLATTLPVLSVDEQGFGIYAGSGYRQLIDSPVEMGCFEDAMFSVDSIPHRFVVSEGGRFDIARICADVESICAEHAAMFQELPIQRYLFLTLATADGYGGLEHCDSTSLICARSDLPAVGLDRPGKEYRQFLGLCSHEYFHLWNVKRIRPQRLAEADLSQEVHTTLLWAFEGITSYYDELALARAGTLTGEEYLDLLAGTVTRVLRNPGRLRQSIAESSFDAWTKFYKQDENAPNAIVSYYTKGALVALGLDVVLRETSCDKLSLDDLMRRLWRDYGKTGMGVPESGIEDLVAEMLGPSLEGFFTSYVHGTEELPLSEWFAKLGVGFRVRPAISAEDLGGYCAEPAAAYARPSLGATIEQQPSGLRLTRVIAGGAAQTAGLSAGDILVAIDGERTTTKNIARILGRATEAAVDLYFFRRDRLLSSKLPIVPAVADTCELWLLPDEQLEPKVLARRAAWLSSSASTAV